MSTATQVGPDGLVETVIQIRRCAAVVAGGRRFSFNALVVVGDRKGRVGWGYGQANEVPPAVEKAAKNARKRMIKVPMAGTTIPHEVWGKQDASKVLLIPAARGTGVIAGPTVRAVLEAAGIQDILTKAYGSTNPLNLVKATVNALSKLRSKEEVQRLRGVPL